MEQLEKMTEMFSVSKREYPRNGRRPTVAVFSDINGGELLLPEVAWLGQRSPEVAHAGNSLQAHMKGVVVLAETTSWAGAARMRAAIPYIMPKVQGVSRTELLLTLTFVFESDFEIVSEKLVAGAKKEAVSPDQRPDHFTRMAELPSGAEFMFGYIKTTTPSGRRRLAPGEMARFIRFVGDVNLDNAYDEGHRLFRLSGGISNPSAWKDQVEKMRRLTVGGAYKHREQRSPV